LTVSQVAEKLKAPASTVKYWEAKGLIPAAIRQGTRRDRKWEEEDIKKYLIERDGQGRHPLNPPPAVSVGAHPSGCGHQSTGSSSKPKPS